MALYQLTSEERELEGETYMGYGIAGIQDGRIIAEVRDISAEREYVDKLIDLCNVQNAAPEHLKRCCGRLYHRLTV